MLGSSSSNHIAQEALGGAELQQHAPWMERAVVIVYGSTVSVAMLGWLYALARVLSSGLSWLLS
jgi:hypothetical protein